MSAARSSADERTDLAWNRSGIAIIACGLIVMRGLTLNGLERSDVAVGAAILGLNGDEVVHSLLDVMYARRPYTTIQRAVHIHPTVSELVPTMLGSLKPLEAAQTPR